MFKRRGILSQIRVEHSVDLPRFRLKSPLGMALLLLPMLAGVAAFALAPQGLLEGPAIATHATPLELALAPAQPGAAAWHAERVARGDTADALLHRLSIQDDRLENFIRQDKLARQFARQPVGSPVYARLDATGLWQELRFRSQQDREIHIRRQPSGLSSEEVAMTLVRQVETRSGTVGRSLFASFDAADIPDAMARQVIELFSGDIDFHHGLHRGDDFKLAYEVIRDEFGSPVRTGALLAAEFTNGDKTFQAYAHTLPDGKTGYFDAEGNSLKRAFLQNPVAYSRISSGFSTARLHPVLNTIRAHKGVDFAAPIGSEVMATANGSVEFVGNQGGYGNVIILKHDKTYSTVYGHLSGFAKNLRRGKTVNQGDVIGYVGMTGLSTGPHLHYEVKINGAQVDPQSKQVPLAQALSPAERQRFLAATSQLDQQLTAQAAASNAPRFE